MWLGEGFWKQFRGMNTQGANTGSRIMKPLGKTWGGIKDVTGPVNGTGTVSEEINRSLWGIGSGQVSVQGVDVSGFTLSTLLKLSLLSSGTYQTPVTAGLAQPSAPDVAVSDIPGDPDGAISCKIERWRPSTGGHSLASSTSEVVIPKGNKVRVTFPAALTGQTHWRVFFTISGFGGQGIHYCVPYPTGAGGSLDILETTVAAGTVGGGVGQATGILTIGTNPSNGETILVNTVQFTFKTAPTGPTDVLIGATSTATAVNFASTLNASTSPLIAVASYSAVTNTVPVAFDALGAAGNSFTLANSSSANVTRSAATLTGGADGNIARSLLFDWKDGDLVGLEASFDDYAPQAATHHVRLENVMNLVGSFADTVTSPTSTNTGTSIQVSKTNNYESYVPTHLLYLPEQVVDVLARPIDSYGLIGCQNSVHAIQYVGPRDDDDLPACTITTLLQDVGIQYPGNWCHFRGRVAIYTAEGNLLLMNEDGSMDTTWAAKIRKFIQGWLPVDTVLGYDAKNDCLVLMNGRIALCYSLQNEDWSLPIYFDDFGITAGSVISCQTANRRLYVSIKNGTAFTAYEFDAGASGGKPVSFVSHYTGAPSLAAIKNIDQMSMSVETNLASSPVVVCLNRNLQMIAYRGITTGASDTAISANDNVFNAGMTGKRCAVFGTNIGGSGIHYLLGTFTYVSTSEATISVAAGASLGNVLIFIGDYVEVAVPDYLGAAHLPDFFPNVPECKSYALGVWFQASDGLGSCVPDTHLFGNIGPSGRV